MAVRAGLRGARLDVGEARLGARWALSRLTRTCFLLASTREQTALIREQGRRTVASSRAAREQLRRTRQENAAGTPG